MILKYFKSLSTRHTTLKLKLYRISTDKVDGIEGWPEYFMGFKLIIYRAFLFSKPKHGTSFLRNFIWFIITRGRYKTLLLYDNDVLVHTKGISPYNIRFKYMNKNDIHHQQAFTTPAYRGRGIFTNILKLIPSVYKNKCRFVWGYCDIANVASQKALEKAGYEFVSFATMNTLTKIVKMVDIL